MGVHKMLEEIENLILMQKLIELIQLKSSFFTLYVLSDTCTYVSDRKTCENTIFIINKSTGTANIFYLSGAIYNFLQLVVI